jgi:hypothetical protein
MPYFRSAWIGQVYVGRGYYCSPMGQCSIAGYPRHTPGPPIVARALAILHTAIFGAWSAYDPVAIGTQLGSSLRRPASEHFDANKEQAISFAAYRTLVDLPVRDADVR